MSWPRNELALADASKVAGTAKAKPNVVRAPKKRSIFRPVIWSTKGLDSCAVDEVASSACEDEHRRNARTVVRRRSKALTGLMPKYEG